jgi:phage terminase large subunit
MSWTPTDRQAQALSRQEREVLYGGARGGGKTDCGLVWLCLDPDFIINPGYRGLVLRKSFSDLSDWISRARKFLHGRAEIFTHPAEIRFSSGAIVYMGHWGDPSAVSMYLGREFHKILLEELTDIFASENDYLKLLGSLRSSVPELKPQLFATTNPGGKGHSWVKRRWVDVATNRTFYDPESGQTRIYIPSKVSDNPYLCENDPSYVSYLDSLPDRLRRAWRDGSWELSEGAFFTDFGNHMEEAVLNVPEMECISGFRLFGSLDVGRCTSFGLWYVDSNNIIHRLFSYYAELNSTRDHALAIKQQVETHSQSHGHFPKYVYADPSAWTAIKLNETMWRAPIDEYVDSWPKSTLFEKANNNRVNGCLVMQDLFKIRDGKPQVFYVDKFNTAYAEAIPAAGINLNNTNEYEKSDAWTDHVCDEARYGLVGLYTWMTGQKRATAAGLQAKQYNEEFAKKDWYNDL